MIWPLPRLEVAIPPFWELEDLIEQGFDRQTALALMAARRSGPCLVSAHRLAPAGPERDAETAASVAPEVVGRKGG